MAVGAGANEPPGAVLDRDSVRVGEETVEGSADRSVVDSAPAEVLSNLDEGCWLSTANGSWEVVSFGNGSDRRQLVHLGPARRRRRFLVGVAVAAVFLPVLAYKVPTTGGRSPATAAAAAEHVSKASKGFPQHLRAIRRNADPRTNRGSSGAGSPVATEVPAGPSNSSPAPIPGGSDMTVSHVSKAKAEHVAGASGEVNRVARGLIAAVNERAAGRYRVPDTAANESLLGRWMANEGGLWADNPLNTSLWSNRYPHQFASGNLDTGIPIFPSLRVGIEATARTLLTNRAYRPLLNDLAAGNVSCTTFAKAVIRSPWASSHYYRSPSGFCSAAPSSALEPGPSAARHK
jgi:hypothetical protein